MLEEACQHRKLARTAVVVVRNHEQNSPVGGYCGNDNGGDGYGSVAGCEVAMVVPIRWLEDG